MAIGIEAKGELFGLLVDAVGEVLKLPEREREPNPINLDRKLARVSAGVYRLDGQLLGRARRRPRAGSRRRGGGGMRQIGRHDEAESRRVCPRS